MSEKKFMVFIDGQEGTTGLRLSARLALHECVELMTIDPQKRKDATERRRLMNEADAVFLCLPDDAARDAVTLIDNPRVKLIDASTAHRTAQGWAYGFAELSAQHRERIASSTRIANPGCHATGFIAAVYPLVAMNIASRSYPFTCYSVTGYSGGGKKMIAQYEDAVRDAALSSPRQYALTLEHKHLKEMQHITGIDAPPAFMPIVSDYYSGMAVSVPILTRLLDRKLSRCALEDKLREYYADEPLIKVCGIPDGMIAANAMSDRAGLVLYVTGNDERITLVSVFDNLEKGASGAAVQNMNIALGLNETQSLAKGEFTI